MSSICIENIFRKYSLIVIILVLVCFGMLQTGKVYAIDYTLKEPKGHFLTTITKPNIIKLKDGRLLILRNQDGKRGCKFVDIYDPYKNEVLPAGAMSTCRAGASLTLLSDGKVLVAGGKENKKNIEYSEIYDPKTNEFYKTGEMLEPRYGHSAILLKNGKVLLVGGSINRGNGQPSIKSIETYNPKINSFEDYVSSDYDTLGNMRLYLPDNRVLLIGGNDHKMSIYDIDSKDFQTLEEVKYFYDPERALLMPNGKVIITDWDITIGVFDTKSYTIQRVDMDSEMISGVIDVFAGSKNELLIITKKKQDKKNKDSKQNLCAYKMNFSKLEIEETDCLKDVTFNNSESIVLKNGNVLIVTPKPMVSHGGLFKKDFNIAMVDTKNNKIVPIGKTINDSTDYSLQLLPDGKVFILGYNTWYDNYRISPKAEILEVK